MRFYFLQFPFRDIPVECTFFLLPLIEDQILLWLHNQQACHPHKLQQPVSADPFYLVAHKRHVHHHLFQQEKRRAVLQDQ